MARPKKNDIASAPTRLITLHDVMEMTGLSRSCIYDLMTRGRFPRPVRVTDHAVRWIYAEVQAFVASRPRARSKRTAT